ncbi:hypothetical protein J7E63_15870 [Bacillus sp. ISL-75]|uniref:hypothetical protein n=1 Tax=Bacillus sp. ISL-75 TaxID=2819137 RepID=UPI001BEC48F3|nr:hypothetical protein [Bacillus sp. ISL-75]MBT2728407.1 hypothetical protein [Bacillus sp. ISL-75]
MKKFNETRPTVTAEESNGLKEIMQAQIKRIEAAKKEREKQTASLKAIREAQLKRQGRL